MYLQKMFRWILVITIVLLYVGCLPLSPAEDDDTDDKKRCEYIFDRYPESHCLLFDDEHCGRRRLGSCFFQMVPNGVLGLPLSLVTMVNLCQYDKDVR